jgi:hypothetical protein
MVENHCQDSVTCPGGNCEGCSNGEIWCQDPRCAPHCKECKAPENHDEAVNYTIFLIIVLLLVLLFIIWYTYGPTYIDKRVF